jgi:hypothetical protein
LDPETWNESDYNQIAEEYLEDLEEALGVLEDTVDGFDMINSVCILDIGKTMCVLLDGFPCVCMQQGVLTIVVRFP